MANMGHVYIDAEAQQQATFQAVSLYYVDGSYCAYGYENQVSPTSWIPMLPAALPPGNPDQQQAVPCFEAFASGGYPQLYSGGDIGREMGFDAAEVRFEAAEVAAAAEAPSSVADPSEAAEAEGASESQGQGRRRKHRGKRNRKGVKTGVKTHSADLSTCASWADDGSATHLDGLAEDEHDAVVLLGSNDEFPPLPKPGSTPEKTPAPRAGRGKGKQVKAPIAALRSDADDAAAASTAACATEGGPRGEDGEKKAGWKRAVNRQGEMELAKQQLTPVDVEPELQGPSAEQQQKEATMAPSDYTNNAEACKTLMAELEQSEGSRTDVVQWVIQHAIELSLASHSCRIVQRLLEILGGKSLTGLLERLHPHTVELYESPHGNHVLTKAIEVMPRPALNPIIEQVQLKGYIAVARHRFGCRVLERLIEHGDEEQQIGRLIDEIVDKAEELSRHQYGNFVVQHLLEHGSYARRSSVLDRLLPHIPYLATHRTASHVVQQALNHSSTQGQLQIAQALINAEKPHTLLEMAKSRYGSYVAEEILSAFGDDGEPCREVRRRLEEALPVLLDSPSFVRVARKYRLLSEVEADVEQGACD